MSVSTSACSALEAHLGGLGAALALEAERHRHDSDGQRAELARGAGDDGRGAGAGAAALAGRDEHEIGAAQHLAQAVDRVLGGLAGRPRGRRPSRDRASRSRPICSFTVASDIASCCASVLMATNSTPWMSASIMRASALRPAPPTPTTRIDREIGGGLAAGAQRPGARACRPRSAARGRLAARQLGRLGRRAGRSARPDGSGAGSAGRSAGAEVGRDAVGLGGPRGSARRPARRARRASRDVLLRPSVARKRSASGPSRMLARCLLKREHLLRELPVGLGRGALGS